MRLKRLSCPRCSSRSIRTEHSVNTELDEAGVPFDSEYQTRYRFVCGKCGFPGYSTIRQHDRIMNAHWTRAVQDYKEGLYRGSSFVFKWERIPLKRRRHRSSPSASRDSQTTQEEGAER